MNTRRRHGLGLFIVCNKCGQPGGTMEKKGDGVYEHDECPRRPAPKATRLTTAKPRLVVPRIKPKNLGDLHVRD